ncbi:nuclear transport factor 2 family protein [Terracidiphilus gabretensis]|jgi:ketosteroid isomerase-like protein|uniref:nuclear transport factor 2 family protein n=1 Tax=Terracidiphilus gabretensis TaxID=1577687 RepID=UPI00071B2992|nr:nuclear transport factor 2 family protein [Terracidiphilus gabretensis]
MDKEIEILQAAYRNFNARNLDAVLALMAEDVQWPNGWEGGYVHGHDGVRDYWTRQWAVLDPKVEPQEIYRLEDGRFAVEVHQIVHDREGKLLADQRVRHIYRLSAELIERMDIEEVIP